MQDPIGSYTFIARFLNFICLDIENHQYLYWQPKLKKSLAKTKVFKSDAHETFVYIECIKIILVKLIL